jgi:transcription elongation factor S-II
MLKGLGDLPMSLDILSTTRIGMTVNKIRKASEDKEVIGMAKTLIRKWKKYLPGLF